MMIGEITIGQIALGLTFIVGIITSVTYLRGHMKEWLVHGLKEEFESLNSKIERIQNEIKEVGRDTRKNFLVTQLSAAEKGMEWNEVERERFWEQYDIYTEDGGNSYIKDKVEQLKTERKI